MSTISTPKWRGCSTNHRDAEEEGAEIVKVELPDQRQLSAACQLVLAAEAAAFHKRWMIERPQDYGAQVLMRLQNGLAIPAVTYLEAMRWRGAALAAHLAAVDRRRCGDRAGGADAGADDRRKRCRQQPDAEAVIQRITRFTRPINYLGLPSLSIPAGFTASRPAGRHAIDRPALRRGEPARGSARHSSAPPISTTQVPGLP